MLQSRAEVALGERRCLIKLCRQRTVMMLRSSAKQRQWVKKGWWLFFPCQSFEFEDKSLDFAERGCVSSYQLSLLHTRHVMNWNRIRKEVDRCMMYVKAMTWLLRCLVIRASPIYTVAKKEPKDVREPGRKKQPSIEWSPGAWMRHRTGESKN